MRIDGLTVCVDFADMLEKSIARWLTGLHTLTVVTSPADTATKALCAKFPSVQVVETNIYYQGGASFNKGAAISQAAARLPWEDWILLFDADILPALDWHAALENLKLAPGQLYGAQRVQCLDMDKMDDGPTEPIADPRPAGYFFLFHASDPEVQQRSLVDLDWMHAGNYDSMFYERWFPGRVNMLETPRLIHLGKRWAHWWGHGRTGMMQAMMEERSRREDWLHERIPMPAPKFSILMDATPGGAESRSALLKSLYRQIEDPRSVEILLEFDRGDSTLGVRRNRLLRRATGDYLVFLDETDRVSGDYVNRVLAATAGDPDVVCLTGKIADDPAWPAVRFEIGRDIRLEIKGGFLRWPPTYRCPMKSAIPKGFQFGDGNHFQEFAWAAAIKAKGLINTAAHVDEIILEFNGGDVLELAMLHLYAGRLPQAEQICRRVLAIDPQHADAMNLLGAVLANQGGRTDAAFELFVEAIHINPDAPEYYFNLGLILRQQQRPEAALSSFTKALQLKPDFPAAKQHMAALTQQMNGK